MTGEPDEIPSQTFEKLHPAEKNQALKSFYWESLKYTFSPEPLKKPLGEGVDLKERLVSALELGYQIKKRLGSGVKEALVRRLRMFLKSSNVTGPMKDYIIWEFEGRFFALGFGNKVDEKDLELPFWLDKKDTGISSEDKDSLKEIEEKTYRKAAEGLTAFKQQQAELLALLEKLGKDKGYSRTLEDDILVRWRQEFKERYDNEP